MSRDFCAQTAKRAFQAYNATGPNPGKAHDGQPVPGWDEIAADKKEQIQGKWIMATSTVAKEVIEFMVDRIRRGDGWMEAEQEARVKFTVDQLAPAITRSGDTG